MLFHNNPRENEMTTDESAKGPDIDQEIRINEMREAAREAAGGEMTEWQSADCPPEVAEQFWRNVLDYETADETCHFVQLEEAGIALPPPDELDDTAVTSKLWEVVHALAKRKTFLSDTDHLSDRELYARLWHDVLRETTMNLPADSGWTEHIDLVSSGSDEDNEMYLKYYADEDSRRQWQNDWPDDVIPPHVDPPYDRDAHLPKSASGF
jgi:hypothetical protein